MRHYATLCDIHYLPRAIAMFTSLERLSSKPAWLHLLAMDEQTLEAVEELRGTNALIPGLVDDRGVITVQRWEGPDVRKDHTWTEFCWMMASQFCEWIFGEWTFPFDLTYLDADLYFWSDPETIHREIGKRSIGIIPHRFIPSKRYLERNGQMNVGWVTFKNNQIGRKCLKEWAAQCREWCYNRNEDGKFGDQKYLDEWPTKYGDAVHIIQNIGAGLAPWNYLNYEITEGPKADGVQAIFVHMHEFAELSHGKYRLTNYALRPEDKKFIYEPYIKAYEAAKEMLESVTA